DRARLQRCRGPARVDAPIRGEGIECLAGGGRVLRSTRHQRDRWCLPDDVRRGRRLRTHVHAVDAEAHWRTTHVSTRKAFHRKEGRTGCLVTKASIAVMMSLFLDPSCCRAARLLSGSRDVSLRLARTTTPTTTHRVPASAKE